MLRSAPQRSARCALHGTSSTPSAAVGSSRISSFDLALAARTKASACLCPPLNLLVASLHVRQH